ncbi:hypothetical protein NEOLI_000367 [Neolecta irregularis DAH-3]|uniref:Uncharacterized protein n=1 Tax=Neolecta irregularis (strain DAH-3) TaxID=1198029 RepID=A0A1U7LNF6_NEOID|nr:hypothetical protein NEOLI_000367 [Neolecta irregularis DAH-3]|eukprot:OLL24123.1 hypothetical protein NEOLI_000367 [Neolecta irregularis DAH-3]
MAAEPSCAEQAGLELQSSDSEFYGATATIQKLKKDIDQFDVDTYLRERLQSARASDEESAQVEIPPAKRARRTGNCKVIKPHTRARGRGRKTA